MIEFIGGMLVGGAAGLFIAALLAAGEDPEDK